MGSFVSSILSRFTSRRSEYRILLVGLDAAGKTTILYKMKLGEVSHTTPTIGFNVESIQYKNLQFTTWDIGGQDKIRPLWRHYYGGNDAVIFVVDCHDRDRMDTAKEELDKLLREDELRDSLLLIYANKQDLPNSLTPKELCEKFNLLKLRRKWFIQGTNAVKGEGLYEGLDWISMNVGKDDK